MSGHHNDALAQSSSAALPAMSKLACAETIGSSISCAAARRNTSTARADANVAKNMAVLVFEFYSAELRQLQRAGHMRLQVACNSELRASWLTPYPRSARYVVRKAKR